MKQAFSKAVGKESAKVRTARIAARREANAIKKLKRENKGIIRKAGNSITLDMLQQIKDAWVDGKYEDVLKHFRSHMENTARMEKEKAKKEKAAKRSVAAKVQARMVYKVLDKKSGFCDKGKCCLTSYSDGQCKEKFESLCAPAQPKTKTEEVVPPEYSPLVSSKTVIIPATSASTVKAYTRTLHLEARWYPVPTGRQLRMRVCGKFTQYGANGATVCFPSKKTGIALASVFNAPAGKCVRNADFVAVAKDKLKAKLQTFMRKQTINKKMKKAEKKDKKKIAQKKSVSNMKKDVARAVGGAFKGALGGTLGEDRGEAVQSLNDMHVQPLLFTNELLDVTLMATEKLLVTGGSFMLTAVEPTKHEKKVAMQTATQAAIKQVLKKKEAAKKAKKAKAAASENAL